MMYVTRVNPLPLIFFYLEKVFCLFICLLLALLEANTMSLDQTAPFPSEWQTVWTQIRPNNFSGLIWAPTAFKDY